MESRAPCACRDGVAHTAARGPSCLDIDLPNLLSPKASLRRSPPLACTALPAPSALERCSQGSAKRPFIFLIRIKDARQCYPLISNARKRFRTQVGHTEAGHHLGKTPWSFIRLVG